MDDCVRVQFLVRTFFQYVTSHPDQQPGCVGAILAKGRWRLAAGE